MQSFELEYVVSGSLDGTTPSPAFIPENDATEFPGSAEPLNDSKQADADNIYRFEVEDLGLIDPDFGIGGTFADRFIVGMWINSPVVAVDPSPIGVLSTRVREFTQEIVVPSLAGLDNFYRSECIFVPQGSLLGVTGFDASADPDDIIVRLHVKCPETLEEYALLLGSCCCTEEVAGDEEITVQTDNGVPPQTAFSIPLPPGSAASVQVKAVGVAPDGTTVASDNKIANFIRQANGIDSSVLPVSTLIAAGPGGVGSTLVFLPATESIVYNLTSTVPITWTVEFSVVRG